MTNRQVSWNEERGPGADAPHITPRRPLRAPERPVEKTSPVTPSATPYEVAKGLYGLRERLPEGELNPTIAKFFDTTWWEEGDAGDAWCSAFVNFCVEGAGMEGTNSPRARSWLEWGTAKDFSQVQRGDIIVLSRGPNRDLGHVGFYYDRTPGGDLLIYGGNQRNKVGIKMFRIYRLLSVRDVTPIT